MDKARKEIKRTLDFIRVLTVEVVLQTVQVTAALPMAHRKVVKQVVATGFRSRAWDFCLREYPLQTLYGELAHVKDRVGTGHYYVHAS
jgi:hypothetical protein